MAMIFRHPKPRTVPADMVPKLLERADVVLAELEQVIGRIREEVGDDHG